MAPKRTRTLFDRLSHLRYPAACKLLGNDGATLIREGGKYPIDPVDDCRLTESRFVARLGDVQVAIDDDPASPGKMRIRCGQCALPCVHMGAALSVILEEKVVLGLAAEPALGVPYELLSEDELVRVAVAERAERAKTERMRLTGGDPKGPWADYSVTNLTSGKTYRVALRGEDPGISYCSCPDFRKNTLGTCKHILYAIGRVKTRFSPAQLRRPYRRRHFSVALRYGDEVELRLSCPSTIPSSLEPIVAPFVDRSIENLTALFSALRQIEELGAEVRVHPDAEEWLDQRLYRARVGELVAEIRRDPEHHPLRKTLLKEPLLPYQLEGVAFVVGAGRAILADDMGLGKTIQGIGVAELLAQEAGIRRVLVVCPASLKGNWKSEVERFSTRDVQLVVGSAAERAALYRSGTFFTVCNYEQVLRDLAVVAAVPWDLIVLDEGQRIKNWEAKTSATVKSLRSPFALVLSGTPLENRLEELHSVVEFIDERRLGPTFRFHHRHRVLDEEGKLEGYKNLDEIRAHLAPILLRRTRASVLKELPPRTTSIVRIPPTEEQLDLHSSHKRIVSTIVRKSYISEMDLHRLRKALQMCRLAADGSYFVNKEEPNYSSKLDVLRELLTELAEQEGRKIVIFSEWTTVLDHIQPILAEVGLGYLRLDGDVPQGKRPGLIKDFTQNPESRVFLLTNAGSTGLNLQAADTLINIDLPWNPAVLEQRIARIHRMGQPSPVQVYLLVTEGTLEESLLGTLASKHELALASLDLDSDVGEVTLRSGLDELRRRLEVLIGARPEAAIDESQRREVEAQLERRRRQDEVAQAAGQIVTGALQFLAATTPALDTSPETSKLVEETAASLERFTHRDDQGRLQLTLTLPETSGANGLEAMAQALLRIAKQSQ